MTDINDSEREPATSAEEVPKRIPQVVSAELVKTTPYNTLSKKIKRILFKGDLRSASGYAVEEVLFPSIRGTILDLGHSFLDNLIGGGSRGPRRTEGVREFYDTRPRTQYATRSGITARDRAVDRGRMEERLGFRRRYEDFRLVTITTRGEAERVLDILGEWCEKTGYVSVADYYDSVGLRPSSTDFKWGWYNLRRVQVVATNGGWMLDMPPAEPIRED
jgi:hypothetical protein